MTSTPMKTIKSEWEELLAEMRRAREYGVPGIGAREIVYVERKLELIWCDGENMRAVAGMFLNYLGRRKSRSSQ